MTRPKAWQIDLNGRLAGNRSDHYCSVEPLRQVMRGQRWMRRFDFDPEAEVRLCWRGVCPLNLPAPVIYLAAEERAASPTSTTCATTSC